MSFFSWELAVHDWIAAGSGLPKPKVIWTYQSAPRPATPYIALTLVSIRPVGFDWRSQRRNDDDTISHFARGEREAHLLVQAFGTPGDQDSATPLLYDVVGSLPRFVDVIDASGIAVGEIGAIQTVAGYRGTILEPRATLDVSLILASEVEYSAQTIERIELRVVETTTGAERDLDISRTEQAWSSGFSQGFG